MQKTPYSVILFVVVDHFQDEVFLMRVFLSNTLYIITQWRLSKHLSRKKVQYELFTLLPDNHFMSHIFVCLISSTTTSKETSLLLHLLTGNSTLFQNGQPHFQTVQ